MSAIQFKQHPTVPGVELGEATRESRYHSQSFFLLSGGAPPVIKVDGVLCMADGVFKALASHEDFGGVCGVRFGPRARRRYRYVSLDVLCRLDDALGKFDRNKQHRERTAAARDLVNDLLELI